MFGLLPFKFRFRGKIRRLLDIATCFIENPGTALHPAQISKWTGISLQESANRLLATPELFIKLPKRKDGLTRYRLATSIAGKSMEDIEGLILSEAKRESYLLFAGTTMILLAFVIVFYVMWPSLKAGLLF